MKPLYILLLLYAVFITGLADGLEVGFLGVPVIGIVLGLVVSFCINITMGAGLVLLLVSNGMFHPKLGPAGLIAGLIPGVNSLPFWVALVAAGILFKMGEEDTVAGTLAKAVSSISAASLINPEGAVAGTIVKVARSLPERKAQSEGRPAGRVASDVKSPRITLNNVKNPASAAASDTHPYVQKTA